MRKHVGFIAIACAVATGCWTETDDPALPDGNATLGIVKFIEEETGDQTTLRGLDAGGNEVARLELVHGHFALSAPFTDDYDTPDVDGRKLTIIALGQRLHWETAGFEPVLQMPAHPPSQWALAAFVADPHAKAILDRWWIGFEPFHGSGEVAYYAGGFRGESPESCTNQTTCGTAFNGIINTCGAGGLPTHAARLTRQPGDNCGLYAATTSEVRVAQCCPSTSGILGIPWFAEKACPTTSDNATSCGMRSVGVCKGCPEYPLAATENCAISIGATVGSCNSIDVYPIDWTFAGYTYFKASNAEGGAPGDRFGVDIAVSGDGTTLVIGAPNESSSATGINGDEADNSRAKSGAVYVFVKSGLWTQQAYLKASNTGLRDGFGEHLALSSDGNTLVVASPREDSNAIGIDGNQSDNSMCNAGAVYVFTRSGTTWTQQAYLKASNTQRADLFGASVALSSDGNTIAIGALVDLTFPRR